MNWKLVFNAVLIFIPQLGEAINWIRKHVKKYYIRADGNKIEIIIEIDDKTNVDNVRQYLNEFLEMIINKPPA